MQRRSAWYAEDTKKNFFYLMSRNEEFKKDRELRKVVDFAIDRSQDTIG
jgi:hypothetical protein